jgi:hypothetical protein
LKTSQFSSSGSGTREDGGKSIAVIVEVSDIELSKFKHIYSNARIKGKIGIGSPFFGRREYSKWEIAGKNQWGGQKKGIWD